MVGQFDRVGCGGDVGCSHAGCTDYWAVTSGTFSAALAARSACDDVGVASIGVFCGSSSGSNPRFGEAAVDLGRALADQRHRLVYGGGHVGLMGTVADAALDAGGEVIGVITEHLVGAEVAHQRLTTLEVTGSMHARKARMAELSDGVIVLPGGFGTLDEAFELLTWNQLGLIGAPVVFLDVDGFFDPLFEFIDRAVRRASSRTPPAPRPARCPRPRAPSRCRSHRRLRSLRSGSPDRPLAPTNAPTRTERTSRWPVASLIIGERQRLRRRSEWTRSQWSSDAARS